MSRLRSRGWVLPASIALALLLGLVPRSSLSAMIAFGVMGLFSTELLSFTSSAQQSALLQTP